MIFDPSLPCVETPELEAYFAKAICVHPSVVREMALWDGVLLMPSP